MSYDPAHARRKPSLLARVAPWVGLFGSALGIVQSVTGMLEKAVAIIAARLSAQPGAPSVPLPTTHGASTLERLAILGLLGVFLLRVALMLTIPMLPAGLAWRLAYRRNWENDYRPMPHVAVGVIYAVAAGLAAAFVFPDSPVWVALQSWLTWAVGHTG